MFGEEPQLAIDFILGQNNLDPTGEPWIVQHRENLEEVFKCARAHLQAVAAQRVRSNNENVWVTYEFGTTLPISLWSSVLRLHVL